MTRRKFAGLSAAAVIGTYAGMKLRRPEKLPDGPAGKSAVSIMRARSYSDDLVSRMLAGIRECGLDVRGKRVLLKPNLVEFDAATVINTDAAVIAAALEVFHQLGASEVKIGEGPGHRRDTLDLADDAKYRANVPKFESLFTDLNRDDVSPVGSFAGESEFYFPNTVLGADLIVSLAKMKTHHWAGATLSMKNFFGVVPGSVYGWPKNKLHYLGISESIVALNRQFRSKAFAIVDGVIGMEGNGPIQGTPKPAGVLVMGRDLVAVDSTCARIMGIDPEKMDYLRMAANLGHIHPERIEQRGETIASVRTNFALMEEYKNLRLA
ncbi:MAG TPA: DUF362 domain-containing protein [Bryobacteraceae bacterium]|jgi:uncharacterized protein (DUF362 family)|nr:DUF362 domain-containing protein [Bryobacteraceae bacterium]